MAANDIPRAVCTVVGRVLGEQYGERGVEYVFTEAGAPGAMPAGTSTDASMEWLRRANDDPGCDGLRVLGRVIQQFMGTALERRDDAWRQRKQRVERCLAEHHLAYMQGGHVLPAASLVQARSLEQMLKDRDLPAVEIEFRRALDNAAADPPAAVTASCALLEALLKVYIEDEGLEMPSAQTVKPLWTTVQKHLALDPARFEDDDIKKILSGLSSVVDGIGALRTHAGSAHGRGRRSYTLLDRHALLAVNGAATLASFVMQTWSARKQGAAP